MNKIELLEYLTEVCERERDVIICTQDKNCYAMGYAEGRFDLAGALFAVLTEHVKSTKKDDV
jgi:hypothetical protein